MGKKKNRDWFGYLMNFVIVCLDIVFTFAGQGIINRHSEKNEDKRSLMLVKNELKDNNSMAVYCNVPLTVYEISHADDALELLKTSSLFTKIKDQNLFPESLVSNQLHIIRP